MVLNTVSQIVVFLYLMDNDTSYLILAPTGVQAFIDIWKLKKALRVTFGSNSPFSIKFGDPTNEERETEKADYEATKWISYALYPLMAGYSVYSLVYDSHRGWYSWILSTLTGK